MYNLSSTATTITIMSSATYILDNALDAVGHTPLIRLDKIARQEELKCNLCKATNGTTKYWIGIDHVW
jgi:hypothetical protein